MIVEEQRMPIFDLGTDEVVGGVPVDGEDRGFFHHEAFGLSEGSHALGDIGGVLGIFEKSFVFFRTPSGVVVSTAGDPHFEEGGGVEVVANPAAGGEVEIGIVLFLKVSGPFALDDADFDAEVLIPHGLKGFGFAAAGLGVGGKDGDVGEV